MSSGIYLTIGQMAKLHHINKKTLMFYDEEGIFSPARVGENGYRYYSFEQCRELERILFLRGLEVPVATIKRQVSSSTARETLGFLAEQRERNRGRLERLLEYERVLEQKEAELRDALAQTVDEVRLEGRGAERYLVSEPQADDGGMSRFFSDVLARVGVEHLYYYAYGAIVELADVLAGRVAYHRFFVRYREEMRGAQTMVRPAGPYLACCAEDSPEGLGRAYARIREEARRRGLELAGSAFEQQLVDQFSTSDPAEFRTLITIPVTGAADVLR